MLNREVTETLCKEAQERFRPRSISSRLETGPDAAKTLAQVAYDEGQRVVLEYFLDRLGGRIDMRFQETEPEQDAPNLSADQYLLGD